MPSVKANGIDIEYESFGQPESPTVLLIMGLAMQMIAWPDELCEALVDKGFHVIRFDNRDIGLSHKFEGVRVPSPIKMRWLKTIRRPLEVPYCLDDMALDAVGLLDALDIESAHVVGASMGGMIGQLISAKHKQRVRTFTSIMSTTGNPRYALPKLKAARAMLSRPKDHTREAIVQYALNLWKVIGSPGYPTPPEELKVRIIRGLDRSHYPQGFLRHLAAIEKTGDRRKLLKTIEAPTLVIHGTDDLLVPPGGGKDTAAHIPGARLEMIQGMGHDLPRALLPRFTELITTHANRFDRR